MRHNAHYLQVIHSLSSVGGFTVFSDTMVSLSPSFSPIRFSLFFKGFLVLFSTSLLISNPFGSLSSSLVEAKTKFYNCEEVYWIGLAAINAYNDFYSSCISGSKSKVCQYMQAIEQDVTTYLSEQDCATYFACSSTNSTSASEFVPPGGIVSVSIRTRHRS